MLINTTSPIAVCSSHITGRRYRAVLAVTALLAMPGLALADPVADFYKGKMLTIYVGLSAGGGYDTNARLVGRHIGKYIPGNPNVSVRNMPGAGGLVMTNYVVNVAPKDGLHMGAPQRGVPMEPLLGHASKAQFDPLKMEWIGSVNSDTSVAIVHSRTGIKTWQDLRNRETIIAGTGVGTESVVVPYVLRNLMGLKYKVIAGFPGGSEMNLAMERGEVDGRGTFSYTSLKPHLKEWIESGKYRIVYQQGLRKHKDLPNVPLISEEAPTPELKRLFRVQFTAFELGRPLFVAPGVPKERVAALRKAFDEVVKDKTLLAEADKGGLEIDPVAAKEMIELLTEVYNTPKELIAKLGEASSAKPDLKVLDTPKKSQKPK